MGEGEGVCWNGTAWSHLIYPISPKGLQVYFINSFVYKLISPSLLLTISSYKKGEKPQAYEYCNTAVGRSAWHTQLLKVILCHWVMNIVIIPCNSNTCMWISLTSWTLISMQLHIPGYMHLYGSRCIQPAEPTRQDGKIGKPVLSER